MGLGARRRTSVPTRSDGWRNTTLGDFVSLQRGHDLTETDRRPGIVPVMSAAGQYGSHDTALAHGPGVVVGRSGASFGRVHFCEEDYWPHNTALYVTDFRGNDPRFAFYFLTALDFDRYNSGGAQPSLNRNFIYPIPIRVPEPSEQSLISDALRDVDALIGALDRLVAKKRDLKQAAMQQLLTGKRRLPGYEERLGFKKVEGALIPADWDYCTLGGKTTKVGSGITPTGGERVYRQFGRPFMRSQNVGWGHLVLDDIAFIDEETHSTFRATEIEAGDVFLNITGASIGRSAVSDCRVWRGNVNQHVCILRPNAVELNPIFLNLFLLSSAGQRQIDSSQAGGNRQGLNFGQIRSFELPLPSLQEQTAIAAVLSEMGAEIAALERRRDKTQLLKQGMMQELLAGRIRLV
jgi:type I restriction enzyme S subunit